MKLSSEGKDPVPTKNDIVMRQVKLLQKIDAEIHDAKEFRTNKKLRDKWHDIITSPAYRKELPYVKTFIGLSFAVHEIGVNIQDLDALIIAAVTTTPLFINRFGYYGAAISVVQWFKRPQPALKGDIPWMLMHTEWGRRRVRKAMTAEFGSHLMEVLRETVTGLHKIGLMSTKDKDEILKGKVMLGIRPLEESFDNFVHPAETIQRGEKVKVQKGIYLKMKRPYGKC